MNREVKTMNKFCNPFKANVPWLRRLLTGTGGETRFFKLGSTLNGPSLMVKMSTILNVNRYAGYSGSGNYYGDGPPLAAWTTDFGGAPTATTPQTSATGNAYWYTSVADTDGTPVEFRQYQVVCPQIWARNNNNTVNGVSPFQQLFSRVRLRGLVFIWRPLQGTNSNGIVYTYVDYGGLTPAAPTGASQSSIYPSTKKNASSKKGGRFGTMSMTYETWWEPQDDVDMEFVPITGSLADSTGTAASFVGTFRNQGPVHQFFMAFDGVNNWSSTINGVKSSTATDVSTATMIGNLEIHSLLEFASPL
jgi:hypothetical protein